MENKNSVMLIVDDEVGILRTFKEVFELRGWRVFTAPFGQPASVILEKEKIDIMLLDIRLPGKSGIELLKEIKIKYPDLPIIMITGLGYEDQLVNEALCSGAAGYVSKNVSIRELIEVVNNAMAK
ncbi:MAG: hypothetical protein A2Z72_07375 [Omnitrophica bacterium RBG_13_46_9]|nr:MAG: hypothetical protein A2Z72_07375 [Omnitrophica bacterium RBG_13_46_9]